MSTRSQTFAIPITGINKVMLSFGIRPSECRVEVSGDALRVRVRIDIAPPVRATTLWVLHPRIHELRVAVDEPDGLIDALRHNGHPDG